MGNCKKQDRKRPELDINELFKRIKFESKQFQKTFREIEGLLKTSKELMQRLLTAKNDGLLNGNTFFDVAATPPAPVAPPATPAAPTPVTPLIQIITKDIARIARQIRILQQEQLTQIRRALISMVFLQTATTEETERLAIAVLFSAVGAIESIRSQLQALRDELDADIVLLLGIAGEL
ncbi:hypothetical protein [Priestia megaterium]|jgi:hypothetical protein|uniref:hypothetical protein n=1 Tax=Priestia megaterium TaxID=1404 RepID=UPI000BFA2CB6|nr:hypothetical protein [Priestia megaterium]MED3861556.1 hypothetical protein [Priestia megaterium]MED3903991.1 hypothetical protein [Priestia megaterium]PFO12781.1 hypothetical protein COJ70_24070 [Priestia megaterium]PGH75882.1 hypothetical protein CN890_02305 [Priestia megaterium]PGO34523.1 hypothetical protein CN973_27375 [Priestia megaterium]